MNREKEEDEDYRQRSESAQNQQIADRKVYIHMRFQQAQSLEVQD